MPPAEPKIIRSRRRTIALIVETDGSLTVRAPLRASQAAIEQFMVEKQDWIRRKQAQARLAYRPPRRFVPGETFLYLGENYPLEIVSAARPALEIKDGRFRLAQAALPHAAKAFERWYRARAAEVIGARVEAYAARHGLRPAKLRISGAATRWGSCSSRGVLSFTWRLVLAPLEVIDYVVAHELAHLRARNHSKAFWAQVATILPDYARRADWLKRHGGLLRLD
jgi:hypothetical protein